MSHQNLTLAPPAVISKEEGDQRMSRRARAIIAPNAVTRGLSGRERRRNTDIIARPADRL